jgi:hypothetical protein
MPLGWVLDCFDCGRQGDVVLRQDAATGQLVDREGVAAHDYVCTGCGSGELVPMLVERAFVRPLVVPVAA